MRYVVVFDTNVLFSAAGWEGKPRTCVSLSQAGRIVGITCQEILDELEDKLIEKNIFSVSKAKEHIQYLQSFLQKVDVRLRLPSIVHDPVDQRILECAVEAKATHIITGDRKHLLPIASYEGISIITPSDFLIKFL